VADRGQYLFAVARGLDAHLLGDVSGLRDAAIQVLEHRGLQAVTCSVDLAEFGEEALRRNLESLPWLEDVARAHDDVVQATALRATTAPMRLVTICTDEASVRARLDEWYDGLQTALDRVEGCHEWSVKAFAALAPESDDDEPASKATSGAAYLARKRARASDKRAAADEAAQVADVVHQELGRRARAMRRLAPQDPRLTGFPGTMILNGAYLVDDDSRDTFRSAAEELARRYPDAGIDIRGPWPPYSFATLD
jgi:hypothetical protein